MADNVVKIYGDARFIPRHDTLENWQTKNPVLLQAEPSYVIDGENGENIKFGDGITPWNDLPYFSSSVEVDQTYNSESENAQSGKAVAEAVGKWEELVDFTTTEEVNVVTLSQEKMPKCKEFIVRIVYPISPTGQKVTLGASYCYLNDYEHSAFRFSSTTLDTVKTEHRCHIIIAEKLIYSAGTQNTSGQSSVTSATHTVIGDRFISGDITKIICKLNTNTNNYPVGTQFIIYGKVEG